MSQHRQDMWLLAAAIAVIAVVIGQGVRGDLTHLDGAYTPATETQDCQ